MRRNPLLQAEAYAGAVVRMSDAAALFLAHPQILAPASMVVAISAVLRHEACPDGGAGPLQ